jgi:hypothetical protein
VDATGHSTLSQLDVIYIVLKMTRGRAKSNQPITAREVGERVMSSVTSNCMSKAMTRHMCRRMGRGVSRGESGCESRYEWKYV